MNKEDLLKIFKNKNNRLICLILIIGVVLMAVASVDKNKKADVQPTAAVTSVEDEEKRLANILSQIDGAGEVSVMITYYSSSEKNIAYETKVSSREKEESEDKKAVMTDGEPMVVKEVYPKVRGVIVTADGGGNSAVRSAIPRRLQHHLTCLHTEYVYLRRRKNKMVLKKKEIIAASLVVLIGVAGYLNWSYQDTIRVQDGESYVETGKKLGEAQYVSSDTVAEETSTDNAEQNDSEQAEETAVTEDNGEQATDSQESNVTVETASDSGNYFEQAKMNKETSRSKSLEILNQTAENESFDADIRKKAGDKILEEANNVQKESEIESIAQSKGYSEICVYVDGNEANIMVRKDGFSDEDVVKLTSIATEQLKISAQNIKIVEVK